MKHENTVSGKAAERRINKLKNDKIKLIRRIEEVVKEHAKIRTALIDTQDDLKLL